MILVKCIDFTGFNTVKYDVLEIPVLDLFRIPVTSKTL